MLLELADYYGLLFLAPFLALELVWRARRYDAPRGWRMRALAVSLAVFGTFRNPGARETPVSAGFYRGGSARLAAMLAFREP